MADLPEYLIKARDFLLQNPLFPINPIGNRITDYIQNADDARQAQVQARTPGAEWKQAVIPNKDNIAIFLKDVINRPPRTDPRRFPGSAFAENFLANRFKASTDYADRVSEVTTKPPSIWDTISGTLGGYDPNTKKITLLSPDVTKGGKPYNILDQVKQLIGTRRHEGKHLEDATRAASSVDPLDLTLVEEGGHYITPARSLRMTGSYDRYRNQIAEVLARAFGERAETAFDKTLKLVPDEFRAKAMETIPRPGYNRLPASFEEEKELFASMSKRMIDNAKKLPKDKQEAAKELIKIVKTNRNKILDELENRGDVRKAWGNKSYEPKHFGLPDFQLTQVEPTAIPKGYYDVKNAISDRMPTGYTMLDASQRTKDTALTEYLVKKMQEAQGVRGIRDWMNKSKVIEKAAQKERNIQYWKDQATEASRESFDELWGKHFKD